MQFVSIPTRKSLFVVTILAFYFLSLPLISARFLASSSKWNPSNCPPYWNDQTDTVVQNDHTIVRDNSSRRLLSLFFRGGTSRTTNLPRSTNVLTSLRQRQRTFQNDLYQINSNIYSNFPPPPYRLWTLPSPPAINQRTITDILLSLNIAFFGLQTLYPRLTTWGAKRSDLLLQGQQLHRLLTPIFLHGGIGHLLANSYSLHTLGRSVQQFLGNQRFLSTYLLSGIAGNAMSAWYSPHPAVGASGAIFGLVGSYYVCLCRNEGVIGGQRRQRAALVETMGMNLILGMTNPMIDNWGHLGGLLGGMGCAYLMGPTLYVARVPGERRSVVIDRPLLSFRLPEIVEDSLLVVMERGREWGRRVVTAARGLWGRQEYILMEAETVSILPELKDGVMEDKKSDSVLRQQGHSMVRPGTSLRPRYGHLYH